MEMRKEERLKNHLKDSIEVNNILTNLITQWEKGLVTENDILNMINQQASTVKVMQTLMTTK